MFQLDELLRQDINLSPGDKGKLSSPTLPPPKTWHQAWLAAKNTIRGRPGKNVSLFLVSSCRFRGTILLGSDYMLSFLLLRLHFTLRPLRLLHKRNLLHLSLELPCVKPRR